MLDRLTDAIDFQGKALALRARRQEVLSSNIANADTPGFKARDFDFTAALKQATAGSVVSTADPAGGVRDGAAGARVVSTAAASAAASTVGLSRSQPGHIGGARGGAAEYGTRLQYAKPTQASLDGNSVDLDRERANFADNALRYEATLRFINGRVRTMITAIRGE